jgi:hypothetical protein
MSSSFYRCLSLVWFALLGLIQTARAQSTTDKNPEAEALNALYGDFSAPDLTAPTLLGINANQVSKPANVKAFAATLLGAVASYPESGKGLGVEIAPIQFLQRTALGGKADLNKSLQSYAQPYNRITRGFTISGAQVSTDSTVRAGLGFAAVLVDKTDPLLNRQYVLELAAAFKNQKEYRELSNTLNNAGNKVGGDFLEALKVNNIYSNDWSPADRSRARPLLTELYRLHGSIGMLTDDDGTVFQRDPTEFALLQDERLEAFTTALNKMVGIGSMKISKFQRDAILAVVTGSKEKVVNDYEHFFQLQQALSKSTNELVKEAKEKFEKTLWNATIVQAGGGWTWCSPDKKISALRTQSDAYFLRAALRPYITSKANAKKNEDGTFSPEKDLNKVSRFLYLHTQVVANVQYNNYHTSLANERMNCQTLADSLQHKWWTGLRVLVGNSHFRLSLEGAIQNLTYSQAARAAAAAINKKLGGTIYSTTIGGEVRLVDKVWLEFAVGSSRPTGQDAQLLTLAGLKYTIRNDQRFKTN